MRVSVDGRCSSGRGRSQASDDVGGAEDKCCGEVGPDERHKLIVDPNDGLVLGKLPTGARDVMEVIYKHNL